MTSPFNPGGLLSDSQTAQALDWLVYPLDKISLDLIFRFIGERSDVAVAIEDIQAMHQVLSLNLALACMGLAVLLLALTFAPTAQRPLDNPTTGLWRSRFFPVAAAGTLALWSCMSVWGERANHTMALCAGPLTTAIAPVSATPLMNVDAAVVEPTTLPTTPRR